MRKLEQNLCFRNDQQAGGIRFFECPRSLNLEANCLRDLVGFHETTEPPVLKDKTLEEILDYAGQPLDLGDIPCHTQSVERVIPLVCAASRKTANVQAREGIVSNTIRSRRSIPSLEHKKDFSY